MNIRLPFVLFVLLVFAQSVFLLPAAAESVVPTNSSAAPQKNTPAHEACPTNLKGTNLAQIATTECCKEQKGICGCRAGKIVCCDGKPSTHPACTCHGDDGFIE